MHVPSEQPAELAVNWHEDEEPDVTALPVHSRLASEGVEALYTFIKTLFASGSLTVAEAVIVVAAAASDGVAEAEVGVLGLEFVAVYVHPPLPQLAPE